MLGTQRSLFSEGSQLGLHPGAPWVVAVWRAQEPTKCWAYLQSS